MATSALVRESTETRLESQGWRDRGTSNYELVSQTLDFGLPRNTAVTVTEEYAHASSHFAGNMAEGRVGFRSPKFQLSTWIPFDYAWTVKPSAGLQINPATGTRLNYGYAAADAIFKINSQHAFSAGTTITAHSNIGSNSVALRCEWESAWQSHLLRLKYSQTHLASFANEQGRIDPGHYGTWTMQWGTRVASTYWIFLGYTSERSRFRSTQTSVPLTVDGQQQLQRFTMSLSWIL